MVRPLVPSKDVLRAGRLWGCPPGGHTAEGSSGQSKKDAVLVDPDCLDGLSFTWPSTDRDGVGVRRTGASLEPSKDWLRAERLVGAQYFFIWPSNDLDEAGGRRTGGQLGLLKGALGPSRLGSASGPLGSMVRGISSKSFGGIAFTLASPDEGGIRTLLDSLWRST